MIDYRGVDRDGVSYVECLPGEDRVESEQDALDLVGACGEYRTPLLLLPAGTLSDKFFDLSTGVAGGILLKFSNYRIRTAAVLSPEQAQTEKFRDFARETNRGNAFRLFPDQESAVEWLVSGTR